MENVTLSGFQWTLFANFSLSAEQIEKFYKI